jgi:streptomycin 6-kinase
VVEVVIPAKLATTVVSWEGDRGRAWLAALPELVEAVAAEWDLEVGAPFEPGGNISWVAPVRRRGDGVEAVLKLQHPHPESDPEAAALAAWDGAGAVRLLASAPAHHALLLERCTPGHAVADDPDPLLAARVGASIGARLHAARPPVGLPALAAVQAAWADELEPRLEQHPAAADPGLARRALETMRSAGAPDAAPVLLHGDLNPTTVLAAEREPWLAIDPKPMAGDPAFDGSRLVAQPDPRRTAAPAATVDSRLTVVATGLGVDRVRLAAWCLAAAVEMGVSASAHGDGDRVGRCRAHARLLAVHLP